MEDFERQLKNALARKEQTAVVRSQGFRRCGSPAIWPQHLLALGPRRWRLSF